ncbi:hypothetical protein H6G27_27010 [Nostoc linckia FACHB-104]|nr:hypothetical protein [Nostoc linckia FACHB-104]
MSRLTLTMQADTLPLSCLTLTMYTDTLPLSRLTLTMQADTLPLSCLTLTMQTNAIAPAPYTNKLPIAIITTKTLFLSRTIR